MVPFVVSTSQPSPDFDKEMTLSRGRMIAPSAAAARAFRIVRRLSSTIQSEYSKADVRSDRKAVPAISFFKLRAREPARRFRGPK